VKKITIRYFAILRDQTNQNEETIETNSETALDLFNEIKRKYPIELKTDNLKVAINDEFVDWQTTLKKNDMVVFIPPVAGG